MTIKHFEAYGETAKRIQELRERRKAGFAAFEKFCKSYGGTAAHSDECRPLIYCVRFTNWNDKRAGTGGG